MTKGSRQEDFLNFKSSQKGATHNVAQYIFYDSNVVFKMVSGCLPNAGEFLIVMNIRLIRTCFYFFRPVP